MSNVQQDSSKAAWAAPGANKSKRSRDKLPEAFPFRADIRQHQGSKHRLRFGRQSLQGEHGSTVSHAWPCDHIAFSQQLKMSILHASLRPQDSECPCFCLVLRKMCRQPGRASPYLVSIASLGMFHDSGGMAILIQQSTSRHCSSQSIVYLLFRSSNSSTSWPANF